MTPKQKAISLFNIYVNLLPSGSNVERAKQCALIAVDEIINALKMADITSMDGSWYINEWLEVKQELEKP